MIIWRIFGKVFLYSALASVMWGLAIFTVAFIVWDVPTASEIREGFWRLRLWVLLGGVYGLLVSYAYIRNGKW